MQELNTAVPVLVASGDLSDDFLSQFQARCAAVGRAYSSRAVGRGLWGDALGGGLCRRRWFAVLCMGQLAVAGRAVPHSPAARCLETTHVHAHTTTCHTHSSF